MVFGEVIHIVADPSDWPNAVRPIARSLTNPLPTWLATGPYPVTSQGTSDLLPFLRERLQEDRLDNTLQRPSPSLKDVLDLVLRTSSDLRALMECDRHRQCLPRSSIALWSLLVSTLSMTFSDNVSVLEDATFIMPRVSDPEASTQNAIDGVATILVSHTIHVSRTDTPGCADNMEVDSDTHSSCREGRDEQPEASESSTSSQESLQVPFDAHILPGSGRRFSAVLPVLVIADEVHIAPLMCSVLYQRHVWGIHEPAVGMLYSASGTVLQVVLGWVDWDSCTETQLPTVHLALADSAQSLDYMLGVYDLTDPVAACAFSQFVLGLHEHFDNVVDATSIEIANMHPPLSWRSDLIDFTSRPGKYRNVVERVAHWTNDVHVQHTSSDTSSSSFPRTPSPPYQAVTVPPSPPKDMVGQMDSIPEEELPHSFVQNQMPVPTIVTPQESSVPRGMTKKAGERQSQSVTRWTESNRDKSSSRDGSNISSNRVTRSPSRTRGRSTTRHGQSPSTDGNAEGKAKDASGDQSTSGMPSAVRSRSQSTSRLSNSCFAAKSDTGLDEGLSISNWLFERKAFTITHVELPKDTIGAKALRDKTFRKLNVDSKDTADDDFVQKVIEAINNDPDAEEAGIQMVIGAINDNVNEKIKEYDAMAGPRWPKSWGTLQELPSVDRHVSNLSKVLFDQYQVNQRHFTQPLSEAHSAVVSSRLSVILSVAAGARSREQAAELRNQNEAERRHAWDTMLLQFYTLSPKCTQEDLHNVLLERTLNCPLNPMIQDLARLIRERKELAFWYLNHCVAASAMAETDQAFAAVSQAAHFHSTIRNHSSNPEVVHRAIMDHSAHEPTTGICDAILVASCRGVAEDMRAFAPPGDEDVFIGRFALIRHPQESKAVNDKQAQDPAVVSPSAEKQPKVQQNRSSSHSKPIQSLHPSMVTSHKKSPPVGLPKEQKVILENIMSPNGNPLRISSEWRLRCDAVEETIRKHDRDLLLPVLTVEYKKKDSTSIFKAMNQSRIYAVSSLKFLEAVGITNTLVYSLVTNGNQGALTASWLNDGRIYIMERNILQFDLSDPLQAFQFATVLVRLAEYGQTLQETFEAKKEDFFARIRKGKLKQWSKSWQCSEEVSAARNRP
ncbi:hypothetical protein BV22DRAFT_1097977 [Leucogyrophana mollusca]|uniref:Uncharacterized protein n=1 Tax=Leucogyrophana mollusca TaxID=85980 RepID=A0ACB8B494_9AGAM|nr:hypothetical protein BV22DRAFT_1097977 [Leucogyrophana mollusca]